MAPKKMYYDAFTSMPGSKEVLDHIWLVEREILLGEYEYDKAQILREVHIERK